MTRPPPTPCQRCKAELAEARKHLNANQLAHDGRIQALEEQLVELRAAHRDLDARLVAAVNKHDEERRAWQAKLEAADREWYGKLQAADAEAARVIDLERGLGSAVERLGEFLQAFQGAPDPSENDTKRLVARLEDLLHTTRGTP